MILDERTGFALQTKDERNGVILSGARSAKSKNPEPQSQLEDL